MLSNLNPNNLTKSNSLPIDPEEKISKMQAQQSPRSTETDAESEDIKQWKNSLEFIESAAQVNALESLFALSPQFAAFRVESAALKLASDEAERVADAYDVERCARLAQSKVQTLDFLNQVGLDAFTEKLCEVATEHGQLIQLDEFLSPDDPQNAEYCKELTEFTIAMYRKYLPTLRVEKITQHSLTGLRECDFPLREVMTRMGHTPVEYERRSGEDYQ
jgi:hypothetical protein